MIQVTKRRRDSQGGYALLMIFLMASIIALMLYRELPRVAFESEREKEQLLIDRGEQYTRAIQLFYLANNRRYPTSIDDLEKREKRFLRRRFVDPFTGKDEWRIIHTNGGFLTDSLVQKPPTDSQGQSASNSTNNSNTTSANEGPQVNAAVLQRPSDRPVTPPGFGQPAFVQDPSASQPVNTALPPITLQPQQGALPPITLQPGGANQPGGLPPITLAPIGATGVQQNTGINPGVNPAINQGLNAGLNPGINAGQNPFQTQGQVPPQIPGLVPGQVRAPQGAIAPIPGQPVQGQPVPGQPIPGGLPGAIPGVPPGFIIDANGQLVPSTPGAGQTQGISGQPFTPQPLTAGGPVQGSPSAALTAINQLLTGQRQINTAPSTPTSGNQIGAIAGIASTHTGPSIKVYKDQQKYELWEFVFSPTASTIPGGGVGGPGGAPGIGPGGQGQPGGPGRGAPSTFGPSGTFAPNGGQQSPFGGGPGR